MKLTEIQDLIDIKDIDYTETETDIKYNILGEEIINEEIVKVTTIR